MPFVVAMNYTPERHEIDSRQKHAPRRLRHLTYLHHRGRAIAIGFFVNLARTLPISVVWV
jgi:hypothetical protein